MCSSIVECGSCRERMFIDAVGVTIANRADDGIGEAISEGAKMPSRLARPSKKSESMRFTSTAYCSTCCQ